MSERTKSELEGAAQDVYHEILSPLLKQESVTLTPAGRDLVRRLERAVNRSRIDRHVARHAERTGIAGLDDHQLREKMLRLRGRDVEDIVDLELRHCTGVTHEDFLAHWLRIGRAFGYATHDDSPGEFEKEFAILITRLVALERLVASTPSLREHASETLVPDLADSVVVRLARRAVELFGERGDGLFTSATFGQAAREILNREGLGGEAARAILAGRAEIEPQPDGCHFRLVAPPLASGVEESATVQ